MSLRDLELAVVLKLVDRLTGPADKAGKVSGHLAKQLQATQKQLKQVNQAAKKTRSLETLNKRLGTTAQQLDASRKRLGELHKQFNQDGPSKRLQRQIEAARKKVNRLSNSHTTLKQRVGQARSELRKAGIDTRDLARAQSNLDAKTTRLNKQLDRQKRLLAGWGKFRGSISKGWDKTKSAWLWGAGATAAGGVAGASLLGKAQVQDDFLAVLEVLENSEKKAAASLRWVDNFAAKTPYDLEQVTESFVKLRAYGLDPTNGLLKDLGDTAAGMSKPIMQAVEAIADAVVGENERLKEFGINANTSGSKVTYNYTDRQGKQHSKSVMKGDRKGIERALRSIWSEKYGGTMEKRAARFSGIVSNIGDHWSRFQRMIMNSGPFDLLTKKLGNILNKVDAMAANGQLQAWADAVGGRIVQLIDGITAIGRKIWWLTTAAHRALDPIVQLMGGWDNFAVMLLSIKLLPVITAVTWLSKAAMWLGANALPVVGRALLWIGRLLLMNPIGLAVTAIAGAAFLIYKYWEPIKGFFVNLWNGIIDYLTGLPDRFLNLGSAIMEGLKQGMVNHFMWIHKQMKRLGDLMPQWLKEKLDINSPSRVFEQIGGQVSDGVGVGITKKQGSVAGALGSLGGRMPATAMAAGLAGAISIHVHAAPGMDEDALAMKVAQKIEQLSAVRGRAAIYDGI